MTLLIQSTRRDGVMSKGEWRRERNEQECILICCPKCGKIRALGGRPIDPDGTVTPPLDCPFKHCDFRDYVKLADWKA